MTAAAPVRIVASAAAARTRRALRIPHRAAGHHPQERIGDAAVPATGIDGAQAADLFRPLLAASHNAAELTNSTGKTLDGGPITVYDGGAYGGEALMETLKAATSATHQLRRRPGHAHHRGFRQQAGRSSARSTPAAGCVTTKSAAEETRTYTPGHVDRRPRR